MKVWIDGQCLQTASRVRGIGRYVLGLIEGIARSQPTVELSISFNAAMPIEAIAARDAVAPWINAKNIHVWQGVAEGGEAATGYTDKRRLSELAILHHVACLAPDVALCASPMEGQLDPAVPLPSSGLLGVPFAGIFFDAIPLRYPEQYLGDDAARAYYARRFAAYSSFDLNLCISEFCREESIELTGNSNSVNIGAGISAAMREALLGNDSGPGDESEYALLVGALDWRKNPGILIKAFALLPQSLRKELKLVVAGPDESDLRERFQEDWRASGLPANNLRMVHYPSDDDLAKLYRGASVLVQPALMEGFGLTALEAMSCGTPVLVSDIGALREVVARPDLLFDPTSPEQLAAKLTAVLTDSAYRLDLRTYGRNRAGSFTWERSAMLTIEAMRETVAGRIARPRADRVALRESLLPQLRTLKLSKTLTADVLARAEPLPVGPSRLIIDATYTSKVDHGTGIQRVVKKVAAGLRTVRTPETTVIGYCDEDGDWYALDARDDGEIPKVRKSESALLLPRANDIFLMLDSSWDIQSQGFNSLHKARLRGADIVSCLYDTVPLHYPAFCGGTIPTVFSRWLLAALGYSTAFVCISRSVANELFELLRALRFPRPVRIGYWPLGADATPAAARAPMREAEHKRPTFLMVGTLEPRKGHRVALDAFEELWSEGADVELVIVGKPGWGAESLRSRIEGHKELGRRLSWDKSVSDEQLAAYYERADALIAASYAEGFGLPIVEAAQIGCRVLASDIPVFREVANEEQGIDFFEVGSPVALARAVREFLHNSTPSRRPPNGRWVTWERSAAELNRVIVDRKWYRTYEPEHRQSMVPITALGDIAMREPMAPADRLYEFELVEGPVKHDGAFQYVVRLSNLSHRVWSSRALGLAGSIVEVGCRAIGANGQPVSEGKRTVIPLILAPGDSLHISVDVPVVRRLARAAYLDIDIVENGTTWWGSPLRIGVPATN